MKKIILMFVVLITSIANAQDFNFSCGDPVEEAIASLYSYAHPPTELADVINAAAGYAYNHSNEVPDPRRVLASQFDNYDLTFSNFNQLSDNKHYAEYVNDAIPGVVLPGGGTTADWNEANFKLWMLEIAKAVWHKGHPNYTPPVVITAADELAAIFADSDNRPDDINDYPAIVEGLDNVQKTGNLAAQTRGEYIENTLTGTDNVSVIWAANINPQTGSDTWYNVTYDGITTVVDYTSIISDNYGALYLKVIQAKWDLLYPTTEALTTRRKAELIALGNVHEDVTVEVLFSPSNGWFASIDYPEIDPANRAVEPSPRNLDEIGAYGDIKYDNFVADIEAVIKIYLDVLEEAARLVTLRADRIAEIKVLDDASVNVTIANYIDPTDGDTFEITIAGDTFLLPIFSTTDYNSAILGFAYLGDTEWGSMKSDISAKITEINGDISLRNDRIAILIQNSNTGVTVGARYDGTPLGDADPGRGDLFEIYNTSLTEYVYVNDFDLDATGDYTRLEDLTDGEYNSLNDEIGRQVIDLDPENTVANYGFTPSEFRAATLQEKLDKAHEIAKANDDINAVSGSLLKGIVHGEKITLRIKAKNYPLEYLEEMANDANYEGWKTYIDRVLYLVKTGDGSERTTRENHINGISNDISVIALDGGDDDWGVAWNGHPFIYGGYDEDDWKIFGPNGTRLADDYDSHGNVGRMFAKYHQDNIGLLPGIVYEALLVEIDRINDYVIAADNLPGFGNGNNGLSRESGLKALTGAAAFNEDIGAEWFILNSDVTVWTSSNYGSVCAGPKTWLGQLDNDSFRYMYIIIRNELERNSDGTPKYYNNVNQNIYCN